jgi:hypothetical protein
MFLSKTKKEKKMTSRQTIRFTVYQIKIENDFAVAVVL